ncbi:MAG: hypothetical protein IT165_33190 [Bryobacterales bacterium]|nr:hypothetical protein [Bryobacterales bacterium]
MRILLLLVTSLPLLAQSAHTIPSAIDLPNGWHITPVGRHVVTEDYILNVSNTPDGRGIIALNSGYNPHGLSVIDPKNVEITQRAGLKSSWFGMAWGPDGQTLYVSGGNGQSRTNPTAAPIYAFRYANGKLTAQPVKEFHHRVPMDQIYWSGLVHHPSKPLLYAANRHTKAVPGHVVVFNTESVERVAEIPTEIHPMSGS